MLILPHCVIFTHKNLVVKISRINFASDLHNESKVKNHKLYHMALFNFFKNKKDFNGVTPLEPHEPAPVIDSQKQESKSLAENLSPTTSTSAPLIVSYATGWPIDLIYGYLHKNYEEKGYSDAMR